MPMATRTLDWKTGGPQRLRGLEPQKIMEKKQNKFGSFWPGFLRGLLCHCRFQRFNNRRWNFGKGTKRLQKFKVCRFIPRKNIFGNTPPQMGVLSPDLSIGEFRKGVWRLDEMGQIYGWNGILHAISRLVHFNQPGDWEKPLDGKRQEPGSGLQTALGRGGTKAQGRQARFSTKKWVGLDKRMMWFLPS